MNENQVRTRIFILKAIDKILMVALIGAVIYTAFYAPNKEFMIFVCLVGLMVLNTVGRFTNKRISIMGVQLELLIREKKKEEQRTIMSTRHTTVGGTRTTATKATPTINNDNK
jgi:hypothetical protein